MEPTATEPRNRTGPEAGAGGRPRIVRTPGTCGGKPRIEGHRITVKHVVVDHDRAGMGAQEIVAAYPGLTLADVEAALDYYREHRDEIDADIRADDEHWDEVERLRQRKADA